MNKVLPHSLEPKLKRSSRLQTVLLKILYLRSSKWSRITADLNILKAPPRESQAIRIKTLTSISCSVRFEVFSCDFQVRFHRVCLLDSTIATCFRRIQAKWPILLKFSTAKASSICIHPPCRISLTYITYAVRFHWLNQILALGVAMDARFMQMYNLVLTREVIINSMFPVDRMRELNFCRCSKLVYQLSRISRWK